MLNIEIGMNSQRENILFEIVDTEDYDIFKDLSISLLEEDIIMENNNKEEATNTHDNSIEAVNKSHLATLQSELSRQIYAYRRNLKN